MAAIDKTYFCSWEDYQEVVEWCRKVGTVTDDYGNTFQPARFLYLYDKEDIIEGKEYVLWNTPTYFDIYLIRNCPIEFIQDRLKEQYGGEWSKEAFTNHNDDDMYTQILNRTSPYDMYVRNGTKGNLKFKIKKEVDFKFKDDDLCWWIYVDTPVHMWYNEDTDSWWDMYEPHPTTTNVAHRKGNMSPGRLRRLLNKWNLPDGAVLSFSGLYQRYEQKRFKVYVRKKDKNK